MDKSYPIWRLGQARISPVSRNVDTYRRERPCKRSEKLGRSIVPFGYDYRWVPDSHSTVQSLRGGGDRYTDEGQEGEDDRESQLHPLSIVWDSGVSGKIRYSQAIELLIQASEGKRLTNVHRKCRVVTKG